MKYLTLIIVCMSSAVFAAPADSCCRKEKLVVCGFEISDRYCTRFTPTEMDSLKLTAQPSDTLWKKDKYTYVCKASVVKIERSVKRVMQHGWEDSIVSHVALTPIRDAEKIYILADVVYERGYEKSACRHGIDYQGYKLTFADDSVLYLRKPFASFYDAYSAFLLLDGKVACLEDDESVKNKPRLIREKAVSGLLSKMQRTPLKSIAIATFNNKEDYLKNKKAAYNNAYLWKLTTEEGKQLSKKIQCITGKQID